ncbi:MAG: BMP family protein [Anaerolineae bacterium]|jgi:basic membrane protein A|nr:BMP family protein [Anaerolineae bacterium]
MKKNAVIALFSLLLVGVMVLSACAPAAEPTAAVETVVVQEVVQQTVVVEVEKVDPAEGYKLASIYPGVITDADYNTLGHLASTAVQSDLGVEMSYSEAVAVPDVDRVMREYIDGGYNIIFAHGGQFLTAVMDLAPQFPEVAFICEVDNPVENQPENLWLIDRNFHTPFYVIGYIAAKTTQTGKIGYIGGLNMPFTFQERHAVEQAIADSGMDVEFVHEVTGDFNDPTKGRQVADTMIGQGVDVIIGSMNLGMLGIFEGAKAASTETEKVLVSAKYIDKKNFAPNNYMTSALYDFTDPLKEIVTRIMEGEMGGYYNLEFGKGVNIQMPLSNVDPALDAEAAQIIDKILSGEIVVVKDSTPYE